MLFDIACGGTGSHSGFRFQIKYFGVLKKVLPCVTWIRNEVSYIIQEMGFSCYFEVMDYMPRLE